MSPVIRISLKRWRVVRKRRRKMAHDHTLGSHSLRSVPSKFFCSLLNFSEKNIPSTLIRGISLLETVQSSKFKKNSMDAPKQGLFIYKSNTFVTASFSFACKSSRMNHYTKNCVSLLCAKTSLGPLGYGTRRSKNIRIKIKRN